MKTVRISDEISAAHDIAGALLSIRESANVYSMYTTTWREKAVECLCAMMHAYSFLRAQNDPHLSQVLIKDIFVQLAVLESFIWDEAEQWKDHKRPQGYFGGRYGNHWLGAIHPLRRFISTLPNYDDSRRGRQANDTLDRYMFVVRQMACVCCNTITGATGSVFAMQPLPEADQVNRILTLNRTSGGRNDGIGYRREAIGR